MKKSVGYVLIVVGALLFALSYNSVRSLVGLSLPTGITDFVLMIAGIALVLVSLYFLKGVSTKQEAEVPIYHGKQIVGYRRLK